MQLDSGRSGHKLALVDQVMDEVSQVRDLVLGGEVSIVR
jgi:hypothetical protein